MRCAFSKVRVNSRGADRPSRQSLGTPIATATAAKPPSPRAGDGYTAPSSSSRHKRTFRRETRPQSISPPSHRITRAEQLDVGPSSVPSRALDPLPGTLPLPASLALSPRARRSERRRAGARLLLCSTAAILVCPICVPLRNANERESQTDASL